MPLSIIFELDSETQYALDVKAIKIVTTLS